MLLHIPQVLNADELAALRTRLAAAEWVDGQHSAGPQAASAKRNQQLAPHDPALPALQAQVLAALQRSALFFSAALPRQVLPPMFNRYAGAQNAYGDHVDQAIRYAPGGPGHAAAALRTDLSCTLFLSDPDSYTGGGLQLRQGAGLAPPAIRLPAGDLLLYPANQVHQVLPVQQGERLACVFWVQSLVRDPAQRQLLFDMDVALMRLRGTLGETPDLVLLTGQYHNLLRMWADT